MKKFVLIVIVIGGLYWYVSGGFTQVKLSLSDKTNAPRVIQTIQCDDVTITAVEDERFVKGIWAVGTQSRLEPEYSIHLTRGGREITFARTVDENIPLHMPIEAGFLFGNYFHRATTPGEVNYSSGYANYSQEWYIEASEMDNASFAKLAKCIYQHKTELEAVPMEVAADTREGFHPTAPIRGVYLLPDTAGWQAAYFDPPVYGKGMWKMFNCTDGSFVRVKTAQYIEHSANGTFWGGPWGIDPQGRVGFAYFANEDQRKAPPTYDLSSCADEEGVALTQFYKKRAALFERLY